MCVLNVKCVCILNVLIGSITNSWNLDSVSKGKLGVCAQKCGSEFDPYAEQFK